MTLYRSAFGLALAAAFILVWMNLAVGIIGDSDNLYNLMYVGVLPHYRKAARKLQDMSALSTA
ncbi:MAG: hypothetical protein WBM80_04545 [Woeseiaceae bacterium]